MTTIQRSSDPPRPRRGLVPRGLWFALAGLLLWATPVAGQEIRRGYILDSDTGTPYYLHVIGDSTVFLRTGVDEDGPSLTLPVDIFRGIYKEVQAASSEQMEIAHQFHVGYDSGFFILHLVRPIGTLALALLGTLTVLFFVLATVLIHRRRRKETRRRYHQNAARQYLTEGREAERLRLAHDLHDGPIQDLHALRLMLPMPSLSTQALENTNGATDSNLINANLIRIIRELRAISEDLRPPTLSRFGLGAAIRAYTKRFLTMHPGIKVELDVAEDEQALPNYIRLALFRICQEAMNNAAQHADATSVTVRFTLEADKGKYLLEVEDDGQGFSVPDDFVELAENGHYGLLGMSERAEMIGARLTVTSAPGEGLRLHVDGTAPAEPRLGNHHAARTPVRRTYRRQMRT